MAFSPAPSGGFNPRWGRDQGTQPGHTAAGGGMPFGFAPPSMAAPGLMPGFMPGAMPGAMPGFMSGAMPGAMPGSFPMPGGFPMPPIAPGYMAMPQQQYHQQQQQPAPLYNFPPGPGILPQPPNTPGYSYIGGFGGGTRPPQPYPQIDPDLPAANMTNSTGGAGCEPGYNYFFAPEHTKIHVLKSGPTPPWEVPNAFSVPFHACHVPVSTTIGELLTGFGATNPVAKKNRVWEVVQGGNGKWYKGMGFSGAEEEDTSKTLKDLGWDSSRSGLPGKKPVVYLYITKG